MIEYIDEIHIYLYNGVIIPSVTQILQEKLFKDKYKDVPEYILKKKAEYGSRVHLLIEKLEKNEKFLIHKESVYIQEALKQYEEIRVKNNIQVVSQEQIVCYKGLYAGKYDMIAIVNGLKCLIDIKTTYEIDEEYLSWQLSMYELAIGEQFEKLYCLWIPKGGIGKLIEVKRKNVKEIEKVIEEGEKDV